MFTKGFEKTAGIADALKKAKPTVMSQLARDKMAKTTSAAAAGYQAAKKKPALSAAYAGTKRLAEVFKGK